MLNQSLNTNTVGTYRLALVSPSPAQISYTGTATFVCIPAADLRLRGTASVSIVGYKDSSDILPLKGTATWSAAPYEATVVLMQAASSWKATSEVFNKGGLVVDVHQNTQPSAGTIVVPLGYS